MKSSSLPSDILVTPLKRISHPQGDILHIIQIGSPGTSLIKEVYASHIHKNETKGWKRHLQLPLNIVVIAGKINFSFADNRNKDVATSYSNLLLSPSENHSRITIPPLIWVSFTGLHDFNILINSIPELHNPEEAENLPLSTFPFHDVE
ncbi:dTDP-4-dehydrorhamnose 3,5-epimerase [Synechococcus sp. UW179A]|uniref:dTDP-4-dehydrorhamnose 3,5-epimerase n=1 Tax=Synechococcus sp. UW179A TaxID=2575510 RepID=UPI0010BEEF0D|nr:dTDP-4-dehydrorhamnose 3,5-epimerase [Synechococcus sp. UW179A]